MLPGKFMKNRYNKRPQKSGNLQRIQSQLTDIVSRENEDTQHDPRARLHDYMLRGARVVRNRTQTRKDMRKLKKAKRAAYHSGKQMPTLVDMKKPVEIKKKKKKKKVRSERKDDLKDEDGDEIGEEKLNAFEELELANAADKKVIRELEKKMKMKKKKSLPTGFRDEGLDYLLETIDSYGRSNSEVDTGHSGPGDKALDSHISDKDPSDVDKMDDDSEDEDDSGDINNGHDDEDDGDEDEDDDYEFTDISSTDGDIDREISVVMDTSHGSSHKSILKPNKVDGSLTKMTDTHKAVSFGADIDENLTPIDGDLSQQSKGDRGKNGKSKKLCVESEISSDVTVGNETVSNENSKEKQIRISDTIARIKSTKGGPPTLNIESGPETAEKKSKRKKNMEVSDISGPTKEEKVDSFREDIYGRLRDSSGNVVPEAERYVPPAKRLMLAAKDSEEVQVKQSRLRKQLRGLINRTSESNLPSVSAQVERVYREHSRSAVNEAVTSTILEACLTPTLAPERLSMELVMLIVVLHSNVGCEVGAYFLQTLVKRFDDLYSSGQFLGKELDNALVLISHLYNFQVIHSCLIFDILNKILKSFTEKDIELILVVIKNVGFTLRKDDPQNLKAVISDIQNKAQSIDASTLSDSTRVRFMIEVLLAIRNNNMRKIPNYDTTHIDHLRKNLHTYITGSRGDSQLNIHYDELLRTEEHGRWWIVGSAWSGVAVDDTKNDNPTSQATDSVTREILTQAAKQRMNTDIRRNIFCVIMTADDYMDAYEKLLRLGLQHKQEREIIYVIVDCCMQEKTYNQFYAYVMQKICHHDRRFQMTLQFHVWDKLKSVGDMSDIHRTNLARLLSHLIATKALSISVLKVIEFGTLVKETARLLRALLTSLLTDYPESTTQEVFGRAVGQPKLRQFCDGLKLFLRHFMLKGAESTSESLRTRVEIACGVLSSAHGKMAL